jgi:hypothetical protein
MTDEMPTRAEAFRAEGRRDAEAVALKEQMVHVIDDIETLKRDMSDLKVMIGELQTSIKLLTAQQPMAEVWYGFLLFGAAGGGLYLHAIESWHAVVLAIGGALMTQRVKLTNYLSKMGKGPNGG